VVKLVGDEEGGFAGVRTDHVLLGECFSFFRSCWRLISQCLDIFRFFLYIPFDYRSLIKIFQNLVRPISRHLLIKLFWLLLACHTNPVVWITRISAPASMLIATIQAVHSTSRRFDRTGSFTTFDTLFHEGVTAPPSLALVTGAALATLRHTMPVHTTHDTNRLFIYPGSGRGSGGYI
jgi:hypothetical protein